MRKRISALLNQMHTHYQVIHKLGFPKRRRYKAAKRLPTTPPNRKGYGFTRHYIVLFLVLWPMNLNHSRQRISISANSKSNVSNRKVIIVAAFARRQGPCKGFTYQPMRRIIGYALPTTTDAYMILHGQYPPGSALPKLGLLT